MAVGQIIRRTAKYTSKQTSKKDPMQQQRKTFRKLIRKAMDTEFGKQYQFDQILNADYDIALFRKLVPIHTYEDMYTQWWKRMRRGDKDTAWPGKIQYFALSSGTSGASSKFIPVSKQMLKSVRKMSMRQMHSLHHFKVPAKTFSKQVLMLGGSTRLEEINGKFYGDMSGISALHAMPTWFAQKFYAPGYAISNIADWEARLDAMVKEAKHWDISIVCGIPNWVQLLFTRIIEKYHLKNIHELWPNLQLYIHGGIFFEPYRESFQSLLGKAVIYTETYMASEGYFGYVPGPTAKGIRLSLQNGIFYEFVPYHKDVFDKNGKIPTGARTLTIDQVEAGVEYALLISNNSGAWRYLLGDTLQFVDTKNCEIRLTGRINQYLSVCGEHVSDKNILDCMEKTAEYFGIKVRNYTIRIHQGAGRFKHVWYIGADLDAKKCAKRIDSVLKKANDDYRTARISLLDAPEVVCLPDKLFSAWMKKEGRSGNQYKLPRVLRDKWEMSFLQFIQESSPKTVQ
ncbi:MAG: GH3 auxin-responsive promoter family protein [Chitinophagales bacterium]